MTVFKISGKNNQITIGVLWVYSVSIVLRPLFIRNKMIRPIISQTLAILLFAAILDLFVAVI